MSARRPLGRSGLAVSPLCLGGNVFGWSADEESSFAVLDAYVAAGGNVVDSANIYSWWAPGNAGGESEAVIGRWLAARDVPHDLVIATKTGMQGGPDQPKGLGRDEIMRQCEASLRRLRFDSIPLYYAHEDDPATPLAETLGAFDELVAQGMVGAIAASNYPVARLREALAISARDGLARFEGYQPHLSVVDRAGYDGPMRELCVAEGLGVLPYWTLARGFLTGKYRRGEPLPASPRAAGVARAYMDDAGFAALEEVERVASAHDATPSQVALAWVMAQPGVVAAIASATTAEQARELASAMRLRLSADEVARLDAVAGSPAAVRPRD
jgi:aryl-alcohol dehydrogenase-like predicted oxidoreductase